MSIYILDELDRKIIRAIQVNARLTTKQLAKITRKQTTTVFNRLTRLEALGYFKGSLILIDIEKFGGMFVAIVNVKLDHHGTQSLSLFKEKIAAITEIRECYHTTGEIDFILRVVTKDLQAYKEFFVSKLSALPFVMNLTTHIVIDEAKRDLSYQIPDPH